MDVSNANLVAFCMHEMVDEWQERGFLLSAPPSIRFGARQSDLS